MHRIAMMIIRLIYIAPYYFIKLWLLGKFNWFTEEQRYQFLKKVTKAANRAGKVHIIAFGLKNIPKENGFVFFPNHQGFYDVLTFLDTCPNAFSVVMKKEAGNIILLKQVIRLLRGQLIDRKDVKQSMKVIKKMTEEVKQGRNYLIFAEGTRSKRKNELLDFKGGSFKSAMNAKCPIVPVALIDTYKPFDEKSIKKVTVQIHYLEPILYEEYKEMKTTQVAAMVKSRIEDTIRRYTPS